MTLYYQTTTPKSVLLKLEDSQEMFVWQNQRWEASFFWWEMLQTSSFTDYKEISKQEAVEIQQNYFEYA